MKHLHTKLIAASAMLLVAAAPAFAAEVSRGSEGNGETPRSAPGARTLSERGINYTARLEDGPSTRDIQLDRGAMERSITTVGRKAGGGTFTIPPSDELKRAL